MDSGYSILLSKARWEGPDLMGYVDPVKIREVHEVGLIDSCSGQMFVHK